MIRKSKIYSKSIYNKMLNTLHIVCIYFISACRLDFSSQLNAREIYPFFVDE